MNSFFELANKSPWLAFFLAAMVLQTIIWLGCKLIRAINIAIRGWPPSHLDADGDFKSNDDS